MEPWNRSHGGRAFARVPMSCNHPCHTAVFYPYPLRDLILQHPGKAVRNKHTETDFFFTIRPITRFDTAVPWYGCAQQQTQTETDTLRTYVDRQTNGRTREGEITMIVSYVQGARESKQAMQPMQENKTRLPRTATHQDIKTCAEKDNKETKVK